VPTLSKATKQWAQGQGTKERALKVAPQPEPSAAALVDRHVLRASPPRRSDTPRGCARIHRDRGRVDRDGARRSDRGRRGAGSRAALPDCDAPPRFLE
jgi:hypothetical protein